MIGIMLLINYKDKIFLVFLFFLCVCVQFTVSVAPKQNFALHKNKDYECRIVE